MNHNKFAKLFEALINSNIPVKDASKIAAKYAGAATERRVVNRAPTSDGTITGGILEFAIRRKGQVWSLQAVARHLGVEPGSVSAALTKLIRSGKVRRMGRGQYSGE